MRKARTLLIVLLVAVLLARLGPFGTFLDLPPAQRFAYWIGLTLLLWAQIEVALHVLRTMPGAARLGWIGRGVAAALLGSVPGVCTDLFGLGRAAWLGWKQRCMRRPPGVRPGFGGVVATTEAA